MVSTERDVYKRQSLSSCKHCRAVCSTEKTNLGSKRTYLVELSSVDTLSVVEQPTSYNKFLKLVHALCNFSFSVLIREHFLKMSVHVFVNNAESFLTDILIIGIERRSYLFNCIFADSVIKVVVNLSLIHILSIFSSLASGRTTFLAPCRSR